jgi:general secretion pathway protein D
MKRYLVILICLLTAGTAIYGYAQETTVTPKPLENSNQGQQGAPLPVPATPTAKQPQVAPVSPKAPFPPPPVNVPHQPPDNAPVNIPRKTQNITQVTTPPPVQQGTPSNVPPSLPPGIPSNITPEQVKAFLQRPNEENYIILNFDNADLRDVINTVGTITKENFIISPGVDARITIHSAKKIPVSEVMNVFESVLEANGISLVRSGEFYKVIPGAAAKQKPIEVRKGNDADNIPSVDRIVTQIVPVEFVPATEIATVLTPLLSQVGGIIPNPRNNLLIINDLSSNIKRLLTILEQIDVNAFQNTRMLFFKPEYSDIITLTDELTEVLNALNITKEGLSFMPIERINSLVVFSASPSLLEAVEGWLKKLDEEIVSGQNVFIYHVQNVKADTIAEILNSLYGGEGAKKVGARTAPTQPQQRAPAAQPTRQSVSHPGAAESTGSRIEIITFEPTNSLIILAPAGLYREMTETIKKIDVYPREVLIEAVVAQVTLSDTDKYGIQWSVLHDVVINGSDYTGLARNSSGSQEAPPFVTDLPTLASGASGGLSYILFRPDKLTALIHALASRGKVNILSSPRLLVRDQEEASIEVGSEIPTATSTTASTTTDVLTQNIQYKTVGIKLKIKPSINEEKTVVLDLEQEVSSKGDNQQVGKEGNVFPSFNTTKTKTSVVVPNKQGIVIGGIMEETKDKGYQGIPLLSSIPIFGNLFRYTVDTSTKKELVVIITPYVMTDRTEGEIITGEFMEKLKEVKKFLDEKEVPYSKSPMTMETTPSPSQ